MSRRPLTAAVAALAVTLALSACGGDPEPSAPSVPPTTAPGASPSAAPSEAPSPEHETVYVALGDSLAAGYQPGGSELRDSAYPALATSRLAGDGADLRLENLGCSGETTTSLLKGGKCDFDEGSQIAQAESVLKKAK